MRGEERRGYRPIAGIVSVAHARNVQQLPLKATENPMSYCTSLLPDDTLVVARSEQTSALRLSSSAPDATNRGASTQDRSGFGVRVRDSATNTYAEHIINNVITARRGFTVIYAGVPLESTTPLQIATGTPNDDIIHESDAAERKGGVVSIDVTDETQFFIRPYRSPVRLYLEDSVAAARDFLECRATEVPPVP